ncbi:MAG: TRAP transporter fused permease subunit [Candidatus Bathyarchaeia archaeon]
MKFLKMTEGLWRSRIFHLLALCLSFFHLYSSIFGSFEALIQRSVHLGFIFLMVFLSPVKGFVNKVVSVLLAGATMLAIGYLLFNHQWITAERVALITPLSSLEKVLAMAVIALLLEATRRVVGLSLFCILLAFIAYPFLGPKLPAVLKSSSFGLPELLDFLYLGTSGIFGIPLGVSSNEVAVLIIFGALMLRFGGSDLITNLANAATSGLRGGPAKAAVVASSLFGTISGSGTANVAVTGSVTIPMMKKIGYEPYYAGAIEAVASTGGQIMPPIMGAAAFIMAALSGIPYQRIIIHAILPAILYYAALYAAVHSAALKYRVPVAKSDVTVGDTLKRYGHMLLPICVLIFLLYSGRTVAFAGGVAAIAAVVVGQIRSGTRKSVPEVFKALEEGAKSLIIVGTACAAASLVVGVLDLTALGNRLGAFFVYLTGGNTLLALCLSMVLALILGMGMPTSGAYVVQAATVIPALIQVGFPPIVAHMFCFYFACLSLITPPVAITAYAAASIAEASLWKTGWTAFRIGLPTFLVAYSFAYEPSILMVGPPLKIVFNFATSFVGVVLMALALEGYYIGSLGTLQRILLGAAAIMFIMPSVKAAFLGLCIMGIITILKVRRTKLPEAPLRKRGGVPDDRRENI